MEEVGVKSAALDLNDPILIHKTHIETHHCLVVCVDKKHTSNDITRHLWVEKTCLLKGVSFSVLSALTVVDVEIWAGRADAFSHHHADVENNDKSWVAREMAQFSIVYIDFPRWWFPCCRCLWRKQVLSNGRLSKQGTPQNWLLLSKMQISIGSKSIYAREKNIDTNCISTRHHIVIGNI